MTSNNSFVPNSCWSQMTAAQSGQIYYSTENPLDGEAVQTSTSSARNPRLTPSWRSNFSWVTFLASSSLVRHFLLMAQFVQTTTKSASLWCRSQRDVHLFCRLKMTPQKCREEILSWPRMFRLSQKWVKILDDFGIGILLTALSDAWRGKVSSRTNRSHVSILWLCQTASLICSLYLWVTAQRIVLAQTSYSTQQGRRWR